MVYVKILYNNVWKYGKQKKGRKKETKTERMRKLCVKSGSKSRERSRRTSLIRAKAFLIYTHPTHTYTDTHSPKHLLFTSLRLHYLWGTGERHRREEERRGAKICIGAGSSGTDGGSQREGGRQSNRKERDRKRESENCGMYVSEIERGESK